MRGTCSTGMAPRSERFWRSAEAASALPSDPVAPQTAIQDLSFAPSKSYRLQAFPNVNFSLIKDHRERAMGMMQANRFLGPHERCAIVLDHEAGLRDLELSDSAVALVD